MTVKEAAQRLGISVSTLYALARRGSIGHYRISSRPGTRGKVLFEERHLEDFLASVEQVPRAEPTPEAMPARPRRTSAARSIQEARRAVRVLQNIKT